MDKRADLAMISSGLVLALVLFYLADQLPAPPQVREPLGPQAFPKVVAAFIAIATSGLLARRLLTWGSGSGWIVEPEGEEDDPAYAVSHRRVFLMMALSGLYLAALPILSYPIATALALAVLLVVLGARNWKETAAISLGFTCVLYVLFGVLMGVSLPMGPLG